jgi:hypothetical protein
MLNNDIITVKIVTDGHFHPVFAAEELLDQQSFTVEVLSAALKLFLIGVATTDLRNTIDQYQNCLCIYAYDGTLFSDGDREKRILNFRTGDRVTVRRNGERIGWVRDG